MIKKIQQYLLLHFPLVWNTRFIPMLFILIIAHGLFFGIGYLSANTDFSMDSSYYSVIESVGTVYFAAVIAAILLFVGWLAIYMRNNAFRLFYPLKTLHLYAEFLVVFIISLCICFLPLTLTFGNATHWKSVADIQEAENNLMLLAKIKVLAPHYPDNYKYDNTIIPIPKNMIIDSNYVDINDYDVSYTYGGELKINGYRGRSLLFFNSPSYYYSFNEPYRDYLSGRSSNSQREVINLLKNNRKEDIISLIDSYLALQKKHNLKTNINRNEWMNMVYNPPFYPVSEENRIFHGSYSYDYYNISNSNYIEYSKLENNYTHILRTHVNNEDLINLSLICVIFSLLASVFIFSFRVTNLKSWLIGLISSGIVIFITTISIMLITDNMNSRGDMFMLFFSTFWISVFLVLIGYIISKVINSGNKGFSNIPMNIMLWLLPFIYPLIYTIYFIIKSWDHYYDDVDEKKIIMLNIPITIIAMLFICILIRKWKSLPEE